MFYEIRDRKKKMKTRNPRVVLCGEVSTGKTSLVHFAINRAKTESPRTTTAALFSNYSTTDFPIRTIDIWDTAGMEQYRSLNSGYFESANGAILVFDITNYHTFEALEDFLKEFLEKTRYSPVIVVAANKVDLKDQEDVTEDEITEWCQAHGCTWFYTSALTGENVIKMFDYIARALPEIEETMSTVTVDEQREVVKHCC